MQVRKISPNSCNLLRKPELYMTRKYIFWFSSQLRLYFNPKIVSVFGTWDIKLCSLLSLSPFLPRVEYYFSQQSLSAMTKPPKNTRQLHHPNASFSLLQFCGISSKRNIFAKKLDGNRFRNNKMSDTYHFIHVFWKNFGSNQRSRLL